MYNDLSDAFMEAMDTASDFFARVTLNELYDHDLMYMAGGPL